MLAQAALLLNYPSTPACLADSHGDKVCLLSHLSFNRNTLSYVQAVLKSLKWVPRVKQSFQNSININRDDHLNWMPKQNQVSNHRNYRLNKPSMERPRSPPALRCNLNFIFDQCLDSISSINGLKPSAWCDCGLFLWKGIIIMKSHFLMGVFRNKAVLEILMDSR